MIKLTEFIESRPKMFKRLVNGTDLSIINYSSASYANAFHKERATAIIQMKSKPFFFGMFKEYTVQMPKHLKLKQFKESKEWYIGYDNDMKTIVTYSEGKEHLRKLIAEFKNLKHELSAKDFEEDFI